MGTSGRDIAMFKYIDTFFDDDQYRKLCVHFTINDISFAEKSVDRRMEQEMRLGKEALSKEDKRSTIEANSGGPYGSKVLRGVQEASERVWEKVLVGEDGVASNWWKATLPITARDDGEWTCSIGNKSYEINKI